MIPAFPSIVCAAQALRPKCLGSIDAAYNGFAKDHLRDAPSLRDRRDGLDSVVLRRPWLAPEPARTSSYLFRVVAMLDSLLGLLQGGGSPRVLCKGQVSWLAEAWKPGGSDVLRKQLGPWIRLRY